MFADGELLKFITKEMLCVKKVALNARAVADVRSLNALATMDAVAIKPHL